MDRFPTGRPETADVAQIGQLRSVAHMGQGTRQGVCCLALQAAVACPVPEVPLSGSSAATHYAAFGSPVASAPSPASSPLLLLYVCGCNCCYCCYYYYYYCDYDYYYSITYISDWLYLRRRALSCPARARARARARQSRDSIRDCWYQSTTTVLTHDGPRG